MEMIKKSVATITGNPVGAIAGAVAFYFGAKKLAKIENKWAVIGLTVVGGFVGATVQGKMKAKASVPTASVTK